MNIACLMPTYGRSPELLNNSLACFKAQNYTDKMLIILDDLGTLQGSNLETDDKVGIYSTQRRRSSMGDKYNVLCDIAERNEADAILVWDDDDVYLEDYITSHAAILHENPWSKPDTIITAYTNPPSRESALGRFHGTVGARLDFLKEVNYWEDTRRGTFDQEFIAKLEKNCKPGIPSYTPQYVYRWGTTQSLHSSGRIHEEAYYLYKPQYVEPIKLIKPEYDADTIRIRDYIQANSL